MHGTIPFVGVSLNGTSLSMPIDPAAQAGFTFVAANGGTLTARNQAALNVAITNFKSAGLWTKMVAAYLIAGGNATSHTYNWKDPAKNATFGGSMTHNSTGMQGNAVDAYMLTAFKPSDLGAARYCALYSQGSGSTGTSLMGSKVSTDFYNAAGDAFSRYSGGTYSPNGLDSCYCTCGGGETGSPALSFNYPFLETICWGRDGDASRTVYRNKGVLDTISAAVETTTRSTVNYAVLACNCNGTIQEFSNAKIACVIIINGTMSSAEHANLSNIIETLQRGLGPVGVFGRSIISYPRMRVGYFDDTDPGDPQTLNADCGQMLDTVDPLPNHTVFDGFSGGSQVFVLSAASCGGTVVFGDIGIPYTNTDPTSLQVKGVSGATAGGYPLVQPECLLLNRP